MCVCSVGVVGVGTSVWVCVVWCVVLVTAQCSFTTDVKPWLGRICDFLHCASIHSIRNSDLHTTICTVHVYEWVSACVVWVYVHWSGHIRI